MYSFPKSDNDRMTPEKWKKFLLQLDVYLTIMKIMPPPGSTYKYEGKELSGKDVATGKVATINYLKPPRSSSNDTTLGGDVEPIGIYMTQSMGYVPEGWTSGIVTLNNPLVFIRLDDDTIYYKHRLSQQFGNKKGKDLTEELERIGHDGIIVINEHGHIGTIIAFEKTVMKEYSEEEIAESQIEHRRALANPPPLILD